MLKFVLMAILNVVAGFSFLVAAIAGIDFLADGITLFTSAGELTLTALALGVSCYVIVVVMSLMTVTNPTSVIKSLEKFFD